MAPPLGVCAAREIIPGLWGMSETPGIISLGQHIAGENQRIPGKPDIPPEKSWKVLTGARRRVVRT